METTTYYNEMLQKGQEFQDYVMVKLYKYGIVIMPFSSKKYQYEIGEGISPFEIKFDDRMKDTGNIYVELYEKSNASNTQWVSSGVNRDDNTLFYIIGDKDGVFLFNKKILKALSKRTQYRHVEIPTSKGVLIPIEDAKKYSTYFNFKENKIE